MLNTSSPDEAAPPLIGLVIVAHQPLGQALALAAQHVLGSVAQLAVVDVAADVPLAQVRQQAEAAIAQVDSGHGVLVLADLIGATPCNAVQALASPQVQIITGVNLPMLLRAVSYRHQAWPVLLNKVLQGATQCVVRIKPEEQ